jgi:hypothetical protein
MNNCQNCQYWLPKENWWCRDKERNVFRGQCRKNPPVVFITHENGQWPRTMDDDWCGEFKAKVIE